MYCLKIRKNCVPLQPNYFCYFSYELVRILTKKLYLCGVNERRDIIVSNTLAGIGKGEVAGYLCHAYCHKGFCEFKYNNNVYRLKVGECLIIRRGDLLKLDAERFKKGDLPLSNLLSKYCSYIVTSNRE